MTNMLGAPFAGYVTPAGAGDNWSANVHGLHVDEFFDAVAAELASVAGVLDAAERQPRIGSDERVHEGRARVEGAGDALAAGGVAGEDGGAEAEAGVVGDADGVGLVARADDRG